MIDKRYKFRCGVTLAELIVTMVIAITLIFAVAVLLVGGQRAWNKTYASAHKKIKEDARIVTLTFGSIGRRANRLYKLPPDPDGYKIYKKSGDNFTLVVPLTAGLEVVSGDAVEFRYWNVDLDKTDSQNLLNVQKTATAYAFFYLDGNKLKVDYGPYKPPTQLGAVPVNGGTKNAVGKTIVLADNVSAGPGGAFSHTTEGKIGKGSVRINVVLTDPKDGETVKVMTSTFMRNIWPR